jgi:hypothetical protein
LDVKTFTKRFQKQQRTAKAVDIFAETCAISLCGRFKGGYSGGEVRRGNSSRGGET